MGTVQCLREGVTYIVDLLLEFSLGFGQAVDLVLLTLEIIQGLLMSFLESSLLLRQLHDGVIQTRHLLRQILHLTETSRIVTGTVG
ncbi:hypothetical protein chiPu_0030069 [Chiloscyllium punctatum]|uniref:Uncharacterized protein n=1 Tax=Chiloscyllium punctatum TaxID=137246 RepID=A0A401TT85_CHIPU|nr:hypothetical protein [Chiloscyllium punctatum]